MTRHFGDFKNLRGLFQGFTLAEVLVTLGIIGVVAAMTMPSLISNYQKKVLENQFKKSYSTISQAVQFTILETGEGLNNQFNNYDGENHIYTNIPAFKQLFYKNANVIGDIKYDKVQNYNGTQSYKTGGVDYPIPEKLMKDGTAVSATITNYKIYIVVDINGPKKRPNKYGHDIFKFYLDNRDALVPGKMSKIYTEDELKDEYWADMLGEPCTIKSKQKGNGIGCAYYAFNDICPDDETKGYWECLPH